MKIKIETIELVYCYKIKRDTEIQVCILSKCPYYKGIYEATGYLDCSYLGENED